MVSRFVAVVALVLCTSGAALADPPSAPAQSITTEISNAILQAVGSAGDLVNRELLRVQNSAHGEVTYFKRFDLQVRTASNAYRNVRLHQGTIIDPRGTTLVPGQSVTIYGVPQNDGTLNANQITVDR
jgi:hypothetical protein